MGKTTLALRASVANEQNVLYVPAASFPPKAANSSHLSMCFTGASDFFDGHRAIASDFLPDEKLQRILLLLTDKTLSQNHSEFTLVVDGLDESPLLTSSNGLPLLFDALAGIKIRTILTMRSEYWATNRDALLTGYRTRVASNIRNSKNKSFCIIHLRKWGDQEIMLLINRAAETEEDAGAKANLRELCRVLKDGQMERFYGDIPRRPLFLRMLIDDVKGRGVGHLTLVDLFEEWIDQKVLRDIASPLRIGNVPREGISPTLYKPDLIKAYSRRCMMRAAEIMARVDGSELLLYPNCRYDEVARHELRGHEDMTGLVLNSLLLPDQTDSERETLRFAHRAFQEFFTAKVIRKKRLPLNVVLPTEVVAWIERLDEKANVTKTMGESR